MKKLFRYLMPLFWIWLGGAIHMATFYAAWQGANPSLRLHWFSYEQILFWPWYCTIMVIAWCA